MHSQEILDAYHSQAMADLLVWAPGVGVRRGPQRFEAIGASHDPIVLPPLSVRVLAAFCEPADPERVTVTLAQRFGVPPERIRVAIEQLHGVGMLASPVAATRVQRGGRVTPTFDAREPHDAVVLVDVHHRTLYDADTDLDGDVGDAAALALARHDGFAIERFDAQYAALPEPGHTVLLVHGLRPTREGLPFDGIEAMALVQWIERGGAALVVAGHDPNEPGMEPLLEALGLGFRGGHAHHADHPNPQGGRCSWFVMERDLGLCEMHPILGDLPVARVGYYCGGAMTCAPEHAVLRFPDGTTVDGDPSNEVLVGMCALPFGRGRIAIALDRGMFRCQEIETPQGVVCITMGEPGLDNAALLVATLRWLAA